MKTRDQKTLEMLSRPDSEWMQEELDDVVKVSRATFLKKLIASGAILGGVAFLGGCSTGEDEASSGTGEPEADSNLLDERGNQASEGPTGSTRGASDPTDCGDLSGLPAEEQEKREIYGYVEETSFPDSRCGNCSLYLPPDEEGGCGGCILFSGPVFADAYCDYWAPVNEG